MGREEMLQYKLEEWKAKVRCHNISCPFLEFPEGAILLKTRNVVVLDEFWGPKIVSKS